MTQKSESKSDSSSAGEGAAKDKPSVEELLATYGKGRGNDNAKAASDDQPDLGKRVEELEAQLRSERFAKEMASAIPAVKGDLDWPDDVIEGYIYKRASSDPRIEEVWNAQKSDPTAFKQMLEGLHDELAQTVNTDSGSDARRVANAARNARKSSESPARGFDDIRWSSLSDSEFQAKKDEIYAAAERGELR